MNLVEEEELAKEEAPPEPARILTFDDIVIADDLVVKEFYIPEWKGTVRLRVLSAAEAIDFQNRIRIDPRKKHESWVDIFALCAVDANGKRLFDNDRQINVLKRKSTAVLMRMQRTMTEMNGFAQPQKTWDTVQKILVEAGVDSDIIARAEQRWREDDEAPLKNA